MKSLHFADKLMPILTTLITEISKLSFIAFICMGVVAGLLMLIGNEHGAMKLGKQALKGYIIIQILSMLVG